MRPVLGSVAFAAALVVGDARAASNAEQCANHGEAAQTLRSQSHLQDARVELVACAQDGCPAFIRKDCTRWLHEVDQEIPSIVVRAKTADGSDIVDGSVAVDDKARGSLGLPIVLDPGPHTIHITARDVTADKRVLIALGEQNRLIVVEATASTATTKPEPFEPKPAKPEESARPGPLPWVLGGVGVVGLGVFGGLQLSAQGDHDDLKGSCGHACAPERTDAIHTKVVISAVALGVGIVSLGAAAYFWLTAHR